tara:strand:+ start:57475 stop:58425 length:951 start_codon:yes stop_codon:yes gene_type:complete
MDVFAITHADDDHIAGSTEFFHLEHAEKYQGDGRVKIKTLWVPAALILEKAENGSMSSEAKIWRQEARYRLREGKGIQVFSKPSKLKEWLEKAGLSLESRKDLITDAGTLAKGFTLANDGVEFFCHSPFIVNSEQEELRNDSSLIFQVRFQFGASELDYFAFGDTDYTNLEAIVEKSKRHGNADRLQWDLLNIPHHCSYKALNSEKGARITEPTALVQEFLKAGRRDSYLVSSSDPISETSEGEAQKQPPHVQAKRAYVRSLQKIEGRRFVVTMEEPNKRKPEPLIFVFTENGLSLKSSEKTASAKVSTIRPARAG